MTAHTDVICQPRVEPRWINDESSVGARFYLTLMLGDVQTPGSVAILTPDGQLFKWWIRIGSQPGRSGSRKPAVTSQASWKGRSIKRQIGHLKTGRQFPRACFCIEGQRRLVQITIACHQVGRAIPSGTDGIYQLLRIAEYLRTILGFLIFRLVYTGWRRLHLVVALQLLAQYRDRVSRWNLRQFAGDNRHRPAHVSLLERVIDGAMAISAHLCTHIFRLGGRRRRHITSRLHHNLRLVSRVKSQEDDREADERTRQQDRAVLQRRCAPVVFPLLHPRKHSYGLFFLGAPICSDLTIP